MRHFRISAGSWSPWVVCKARSDHHECRVEWRGKSPTPARSLWYWNTFHFLTQVVEIDRDTSSELPLRQATRYLLVVVTGNLTMEFCLGPERRMRPDRPYP